MIAPVCDVIMLAWNKREMTQRCVESYLLHTKIPTRLILIDNASTDDTAAYFSSLKSTSVCDVQIVINSKNLGFVGGMNQGIALSSAPFVCLANNDLLFSSGWLEELMNVFKSHPQVGLMNPNSNNFGTRVPKGIDRDAFAEKLHLENSGGFIEMPNCVGFCMVIPREVLRKVGGLSEEFQPMFFEDTDYSRKVTQAGYRIGFALGSYVWHEEHASMSQLSDKGVGQFVRSRKIFENKWGKILRILYVAPNAKITKDDLEVCVALARHGDSVTMTHPAFSGDPQDIFKRWGVPRHSGVAFFECGSVLKLLWRILTKKKKFHVVIGLKAPARFFLRIRGIYFMKDPELSKIREFKHHGNEF